MSLRQRRLSWFIQLDRARRCLWAWHPLFRLSGWCELKRQSWYLAQDVSSNQPSSTSMLLIHCIDARRTIVLVCYWWVPMHFLWDHRWSNHWLGYLNWGVSSQPGRTLALHWDRQMHCDACLLELEDVQWCYVGSEEYCISSSFFGVCDMSWQQELRQGALLAGLASQIVSALTQRALNLSTDILTVTRHFSVIFSGTIVGCSLPLYCLYWDERWKALLDS